MNYPNNNRYLFQEIPPYETRPVMQASFMGQVVDNHTAFIRIRTNHTDFAQYLILAMEVEVSSGMRAYIITSMFFHLFQILPVFC